MRLKKTEKEWANSKARAIIETGKFMMLATSDRQGYPWAAAVNYVFDGDYNFYVLTRTKTQHMEHIKRNPNIAFVIVGPLTRQGVDEVQCRGTASTVDRSELRTAVDLYNKNPGIVRKLRVVEEFVGNAKNKFIKLVVTEAYTLDMREKNPDIRERLKVDLKG